MFKLESYITPILLNYVAKYVKNIRDEDAQVSLWEGEVTFQNLDLRLDVLEEELNLPVELVSGHIHELSIQVPWTKLTSEPVKIEINTIEFVAKLPDEEDKKRLLAERRKQKQNGDDIVDQPGGAAISSGVVNKIINNINLECHNIILKYVEDDIVVSMNVQYLNFSSANEKWEPTMIDVHPVSVLIRKLLQVSDLTICLDKRNTAGRIEVCQEPILYRCTLELRVLRKYNANTVSTSSTTRIGVFTKSLDINVSSLQFPLVMRLVKMLLELKPATVKEDNVLSLEETVAPPTIDAAPQRADQEPRSTMFGWAWNLLPSFETPPASPAVDEPVGHAFDLGIYAEELNFQLKNSEIFIDHTMGGIKRIRYTPIMRISLGGIYYERSQLKESEWANVRAGLSRLNMEPLGIYRSDEGTPQTLMNSKESENERGFIDKSLFDELYMFADKNWSSNNHDDYYARHTDEYMLYRSPVLAFDIVEYRAPWTDTRNAARIDATTEAQLKDAGLRVKYRLLSAGITFHFSQSFLQVKNVISDLLRPYDYTGIHAEAATENPTRPVTRDQEYKIEYMTNADIEYLVSFMPVCNYNIDLRNITVKFYPRQQSAESSTAATQHRLSTTVSQTLLPYLQLKMSSVVGTICGPSNPKRLVQLITHLQDKPREIIDSCYTAYKLNVKNLTVMALNTTPEMGSAKLVNIPSMQVQYNSLVLSHLWRQNVAALETAEIQSELITLAFSKRELVLVNRMIMLIIAYDSGQLGALARLVARANLSSDVIKLQTLITKLKLNYRKYHTHLAMLVSLRNLNTDVFHTMMNIRNVVISTNKGVQNKWLELQLQIPLQDATVSSSNQIPATAVCIWLDNFCITLDVYLVQFFNSFNFEECPEHDLEGDSDSYSLLERHQSFSNISYTSAPAVKPANNDFQPRRALRNSRKVSNPAETIHLSSEREEKSAVNTDQVKAAVSISSVKSPLDLVGLIQRLSSIIVIVDMSKARIDVCEVMLRKNIKEQAVEFTSIRLPHTKISSINRETVFRGNLHSTIYMPKNKDLAKWVIELRDFYMCLRSPSKTDMIIAPVQTTITIALSHKIIEKPRTKPVSSTDSFLEDHHVDLSKQKRAKKVDWNKKLEDEPAMESVKTCSINVHVDMSEISIFGHRLKILHEHFVLVHAIYKAISSLDANNECLDIAAKRLPQIHTGNVTNHQIIKEFLDLDPDFVPSDLENEVAMGESLIIFCQWTIPRISLEMETLNARHQRKIVLNFEDLLLNVDKHPDFTKITSKVENVSLNYYEAKTPGDWRMADNIYIKMLGDSSNLPMISVVVTTVSLKDLYSKIGAINLYNNKRTITELIIDLQPIEMILDVDKLTEFLIYQCELLELMRTDHGIQHATSEDYTNRERIITVEELPMVHLNSKGIYIYIPQDTDKTHCSVLLMRIESIKLKPSVENPLVRPLIRQDIYNKAAELNMLSTPGSLVEDRQYELSVHNISLSTGNWLQTQSYRLAKTLSDEHNNPALEWNNQANATALKHMVIFKDFDFITVYAPTMSFDRFLVSGQIVEYNCVTDFLTTLNTHQIHLVFSIIDDVQRLRSIVDIDCSKPRTNDKTFPSGLHTPISQQSSYSMYKEKSGISLNQAPLTKMSAARSFHDIPSDNDIMLDVAQSDSGINMTKNTTRTIYSQAPTTENTGVRARQKLSYPSSVSFVAGKFSLQVYDVVEIEKDMLLMPLLLITISQPSFLAMKTLHSATTQASIFDFNIHLAKTATERKLVRDMNDDLNKFSEFIFDTMPGTLGRSGIPPPLLSVKAHRDRSQQLEVDVELGKPMLIRLCERSVKLILSDLIRIYTLLQDSPAFVVRPEKPVIKTTPMEQVKLYCYNADRLHLVCDRITIKFYDEQNAFKCSAVLLDLNANVKFNKRPNKASIKGTLGSIYLQTSDKIVLHPLLIRFSADLLSEQWCDELLASCTLKLNVLHVDASVMSTLQLLKAKEKLDSIMEHVHKEWQEFLYKRPSLGQPGKLPLEALSMFVPSQTQIVRSKSSIHSKTEFYQDDLRAGAFQFVYLKSDTVLPMPYQVQIIKKNYGIVCWRYPQPRQMHTIYIYPVPMPVDNPIHIKCSMEYFSETHETFLHYCDFELSEIASKQLKPPDREISATIWRVVIMQSLISVDGSCFNADVDEELQSIESNRVAQDFRGNLDNDFILHPKVLVGCMRIDTAFRVDLVPKLQFLLSCRDIEVNFLNMPDASNVLPQQLKKYDLKVITDLTQTFLTVHVEKLKIHSNIFSRKNFSVETNFRSRVKCLDYGFFNMVDILERMKFHSYLRFNAVQRLLNANLLVDKLRINCGPWVIHTLLCSKHHWQEVIKQSKVVNTLMPRVMIVNRMQMPIFFGQSGTTERISASPQQLCLYYFCSDFHSQELTFYKYNNEAKQMEVSDSVHISLKFEEEIRVRHVRIGNGCLTIKQGKLSSAQIYVLVKGQIELVNMAPFKLLTELRSGDKDNEGQGGQMEHCLNAKGRTSYFQTVMRNEDIAMRLKLSSEQGKGRTGDIPLKPNNSLPWLVKVPTQQPQQFISLWVRILREDIVFDNVESGFQPQRILVSIWPIFEIYNLLSCDLKATETTTNEKFTIPSRGGRVALNTATTHSTEHPVQFDFPNGLGPTSQSEYTFMLKNMDWHKFFNYDPAEWTIENTLQKLDKTPKPKWPLNDAEELRVQRFSKSLSKIDIQYRVEATREFSCTLGLEVAAWGMFINATGLDVCLCLPQQGVRYTIGSNCLEMLPMLNSYFTIDMPFGSNWTPSVPISLEQQTQTVPTSSGFGRPLVLRLNSFVDIVVVRNEDVFRMILECKVEDGRRVLKLRSKFVIANFTDVILHVIPLTMDHKETSSRQEVSSLDVDKNIRNLLPIKAKEHSIGATMELFHDLNARKIKHTADTAFVYFVSFGVSGTQDISMPIPLAIPFTRRCFSLQNGRDCIPLTIALIERDNVYYLNVFRDPSPTIEINNNTNVKFIVAQTTASGNSNVTCTTSEFAGKHFDWNQLIAPYSKCYYSPPQMYANFPDVEYSMCNLSLALYNETNSCNKGKIGWSKPIRTDKSWQKFMHVPNHGDIKVVICDKHRVIHLNIYYIAQQMEFSVKDLRTRLTQPDEVNPLIPENADRLAKPTDPAALGIESINSECIHFKQECEDKLQLCLRTFIKSFVFSLQTNNSEQDYLKTEVCNMYADDVMFAYDDDDNQRVLHLQLPNLQVDNQLYTTGKYDFPVLLCAQQLYKRNCCLPQVYNLNEVYKRQAEKMPISLLSFTFYQDEMHLQNVRCQLQPLRVYIEDAYLNQLLDTLVECEPSNCVYTPKKESERVVLETGQTLLPLHVVAQAMYISEPLRLDNFVVEPLSLLLSVHTSSRLYIALDHSPLSFSRYERQQILTVPLRFGQSLGLHYLSGAIFGAGWVVGSLEILGSPSGLARSFSTGLRDFISMPVQGLFRGPWGFLVGVTQGSASLLRNVTAGTVNSVTKLAGSVARNLDRLTLDSEHIELTEARRRARPQGFADGLTQGLTGLGISLLGAVGGLAHHTLEARSSVGVITGLTKGIVGALTKPISGAAEMLALTGQGVLHTVGFNTMPLQVEPSTTRNVAVHASSYRIWRYLPQQLHKDQIVYFQEITLVLNGTMHPALLFVTSTVLTILELQREDLTFCASVLKVEVVADREDRSKMFLSLQPEKADDVEGQIKYTNERIMSFLNASRAHVMVNDSLSDLLHLTDLEDDDDKHRQTQCIFLLKPSMGEHLMHYLKVIKQTQ